MDTQNVFLITGNQSAINVLDLAYSKAFYNIWLMKFEFLNIILSTQQNLFNPIFVMRHYLRVENTVKYVCCLLQ